MSWKKITKNHIKTLYSCSDTDYTKWFNFIEKNGFVSMSNIPFYSDYEYFFQKGRDVGSKIRNQYGEPPFYDHGWCYKNGSGQVYCVYQPYMEIDRLSQEVIKWCEAQNLKYYILDASYSWYNPNHTNLVIITSKSNLDIQL